MISAKSMSIEELLVKLKTLRWRRRVDLRMNIRKTKVMVDGLDFDLLKRPGKVPNGVCQKQ